MANMLDYLDWRGDLSLEESPFNEVDNLLLAELSFLDLDGIVPDVGEGERVPLGQAVEAEAKAAHNDPGLTITVSTVEALGGMAVGTDGTKAVAQLLEALPNGVQAMSRDIAGLVQTSLNLGIAKLDDTGLHLTFSVRSSVNQEKEDLLSQLRTLAAKFGGQYSQMGEYPAWEYRQDSRLREIMVQTYRDMFGAEPQVVAIHAGLECGLLGDKLPGLDCVSFGPQMQDIHTSREKLNIASVARMWDYLLEILKRL